MRLRDLAILPATTIVVMILNIAVSFGVVWIYSTFVNPGHLASYYEAFAQEAAPVSSVVAGIPLMIGAGYLVARGRPRRTALISGAVVAALYVLIDAAIIASVDAPAGIWAWSAVSYVTKIVAALSGAILGERRAAELH